MFGKPRFGGAAFIVASAAVADGDPRRFMQGFPQFRGCAYYVFVDTSDVASPTTLSP